LKEKSGRQRKGRKTERAGMALKNTEKRMKGTAADQIDDLMGRPVLKGSSLKKKKESEAQMKRRLTTPTVMEGER